MSSQTKDTCFSELIDGARDRSDPIDQFGLQTDSSTQTKDVEAEFLGVRENLEHSITSSKKEDLEFQQVQYDKPPANFKIIFSSSDQQLNPITSKEIKHVDKIDVDDKQLGQSQQFNPVRTKMLSQRNRHFHKESNPQGMNNNLATDPFGNEEDSLPTGWMLNSIDDQGVNGTLDYSPTSVLGDNDTNDYEIVRQHDLQLDHITKEDYVLKQVANNQKEKLPRQTTVVRESNIKRYDSLSSVKEGEIIELGHSSDGRLSRQTAIVCESKIKGYDSSMSDHHETTDGEFVDFECSIDARLSRQTTIVRESNIKRYDSSLSDHQNSTALKKSEIVTSFESCSSTTNTTNNSDNNDNTNIDNNSEDMEDNGSSSSSSDEESRYFTQEKDDLSSETSSKY